MRTHLSIFPCSTGRWSGSTGIWPGSPGVSNEILVIGTTALGGCTILSFANDIL